MNLSLRLSIRYFNCPIIEHDYKSDSLLYSASAASNFVNVNTQPVYGIIVLRVRNGGRIHGLYKF